MTTTLPLAPAKWFRSFLREERGAVTIPFVLFVPVFMAFVLSSMELGFVMMRHVMLERALDMTVRDLRLGRVTNPTHATILSRLCGYSAFINDCETSVLLELRPIPKDSWTPFDTGATCVDRDAPVQPVTEFDDGTSDELMLVRACAKVKPLMPTTGLGLHLAKDGSGDYALISSTAFVNEPRPGT
ncbi:TadE/TadG family type IV pilus assembly protein [Albidovulum sediminicola]|uniref:Pilus assembly protein n=1 Tax=Albidovulum sediminicola TaxID=2984331 RepID=A0ABT2Z1C7_9RHOB|nr:TadE family protein [Defluviimonas sp. WL0075]MCV2864556.1 pilus assembly protein [Defluviimonas sp. WL0075]